ncbi:helix-turn-helix domain-containing protein [Oceanobacter mangrovi]|uniref:helix-turn-helix domain-containing protein n=1 Tax=Oceanobacter mangrovi TaxID=2862510 RepID=UPI001C8D5792|nr:helix-turn-helix transcriptional regulator [Oceanobacter mangrovi]
MTTISDIHISGLQHPAGYVSSWHCHAASQLTLIDQGVLLIETIAGRWLIPRGRLGWIPAQTKHTAFSHTDIMGHSLYLPAELCRDLPITPCVLDISNFGSGVLRQLFARSSDNAIESALLTLLMHELSTATIEPWQLPIPKDRRLQKLTTLTLKDVGSNQSIAYLAKVIGMSTRSVSRRFSEETGMSYVQWRQLARLMQAMEWLQMGKPVEWVAQCCGYSNTSAFITVFKQHMRMTPGKWVRGARKIAD